MTLKIGGSVPYLTGAAWRRLFVLFGVASERRRRDRLDNYPIEQAAKIRELTQNVHK
jgi:hypothetical protein